jgi:hypothetical protein
MTHIKEINLHSHKNKNSIVKQELNFQVINRQHQKQS